MPARLEEVGKKFKVTRERVRQIEAKALRKMRHPTRIRQLQGFLRFLARARSMPDQAGARTFLSALAYEPELPFKRSTRIICAGWADAAAYSKFLRNRGTTSPPCHKWIRHYQFVATNREYL